MHLHFLKKNKKSRIQAYFAKDVLITFIFFTAIIDINIFHSQHQHPQIIVNFNNINDKHSNNIIVFRTI